MSKRRNVRLGIEEVLRCLGSDLCAIACSLEAHGVHGMRRNAEECALARYVRAVVESEPGISRVLVWQESIRVVWTSRLRRPVVLPLPSSLVEFVAAFDAGRFPRLVASSATKSGDCPDPC